MPDDYTDPLTARTTLQTRYVRLLLTCRSCRRGRDADIQALVDGGRGDVPVVQLRWRCQHCGSRLIDKGVSGYRPASGYWKQD